MSSTDNLKKKGKSNFWYYFVKVTGAIPALLWSRFKVYRISGGSLVKNKHEKGAVLLFSNHISLTDPLLLNCIFWYRRVSFLAAKELYSSPFKRWFFSNVNCIPVDRTNFSMGTFHAVVDRLKGGDAVHIFPEGEINKTDTEVMSFKSGVVLMAAAGGAPVLPVYIVKREHWYQRARVLIGDPVDIVSLYGSRPNIEGLKDACALLHEKEVELMQYYEENLRK